MKNDLFAIQGKLNKYIYLLISIIGFVLFFLAWILIANAGWFDEVFLPGPLAVVNEFYRWAIDANLSEDMSISIYRVTSAFLLSALVALPLSLLIGTFRPVKAFFEPFIEFARYLPAVAFVPLILLWVGIGEDAKITVIWIGTFFQMVLLLADDVRLVPRSQIEAAQTMGASKSEIIQHVIIQSAKPAMLDSLRITLGWAWTYLVVAELVAANSGLGYQILKAQRFLQTERIFAGILIIGVLGLIMDQAFRVLHRQSFPWLYQK